MNQEIETFDSIRKLVHRSLFSVIRLITSIGLPANRHFRVDFQNDSGRYSRSEDSGANGGIERQCHTIRVNHHEKNFTCINVKKLQVYNKTFDLCSIILDSKCYSANIVDRYQSFVYITLASEIPKREASMKTIDLSRFDQKYDSIGNRLLYSHMCTFYVQLPRSEVSSFARVCL